MKQCQGYAPHMHIHRDTHMYAHLYTYTHINRHTSMNSIAHTIILVQERQLQWRLEMRDKM